jgi:hypothetical protein
MMNPFLTLWIECLKAHERAMRPSPEERRAHFVVIAGGKAA